MRDNILKRWSGITEHYNQFRPIVPLHLIETLRRMSQKDELMCVVDLGSGTGHATRAWAEHAYEVIGIEPALEMLQTAQKNTPQKNI